MRLFTIALFALLFTMTAAAETLPITRYDTYDTTPGAFDRTGGNGDDVLGRLRNFDIDYVRFTVITAQEIQALIHVNFNYDGLGNPTVLNGWAWDSQRFLNSGDLLFDVGDTYKYGVPIVGHDSLIAGSLYSITNGAVQYSQNVFGAGGRSGIPVWINSGETRVGVGYSPTWLRDNIDPNHNPDVAGIITLRFTPTAGFLADLATTGLSVHFASATCGNDVLNGNIQYGAVPEPMSMFLMGGGLLALGLFGRRFRRG